MNRKELIKDKLKGLQVLIEKDLDPIFILTWKMVRENKDGSFDIMWQPLFFSDNSDDMTKTEKRVILEWLEGYVKREKKNL